MKLTRHKLKKLAKTWQQRSSNWGHGLHPATTEKVQERNLIWAQVYRICSQELEELLRNCK